VLELEYRISSSYINGGLLQIEMPFHLSPRRYLRLSPYFCWHDNENTNLTTPKAFHCGPVVPIQTETSTNKRVIRLHVQLGPDFTDSDVMIKLNSPDRTLSVLAEYVAEIGVYGNEVSCTNCTELGKLFLLFFQFVHALRENKALVFLF
jgi:hypothetical protein